MITSIITKKRTRSKYKPIQRKEKKKKKNLFATMNRRKAP